MYNSAIRAYVNQQLDLRLFDRTNVKHRFSFYLQVVCQAAWQPQLLVNCTATIEKQT